ncbi:MAG: CopG family transcriptional regulator [Lautropia sp.]
MSQITLYLDESTDALLTQGAQASGMSKSRWVAELIRRHARDTWPAECLALAGAFPDFPLREELPPPGQDVPRVDF